MAILRTVLDRAGVGTLGVLDSEIDVPILTGAQRQGDVIVLSRPQRAPATTPIPPSGVQVVKAEASSNTHTLHSWDGACSFDADPTGGDTGLTLGTLTVPEGASAYLVHTEEHGANGIGPGTYELRRQREFAGEWRRVAD
ncbi:hypothetical protein [Pseudonocardia lacus]|uniref:hypothetical protein n=1 Tax=Pseudonocardia lacus TaxID=2835865 RepID=UPI001BDC1B52|nr:hypothetical protein [Pseudonocardia lacus]